MCPCRHLSGEILLIVHRTQMADWESVISHAITTNNWDLGDGKSSIVVLVCIDTCPLFNAAQW
jgi:hypothetical protein